MRRVFVIAGLLAGAGMFVTPANAGGGCHGTGGRSAGEGTDVELSMNCMSPRVLRAPDSGEVTFVNRDEIGHNLVGEDWSVSELRSGEKHKRRFTLGTHVYSCTLHPGMVGAVLVGNNVAEPIANLRSVDAETNNWWLLSGALGLAVGGAAAFYARRNRYNT